jgi:hypothetical protein
MVIIQEKLELCILIGKERDYKHTETFLWYTDINGYQDIG